MRTLLIIICHLFLWPLAAQVSKADEAFALAKNEDKTIFLVFSGSDWCAPCIRFQKNVLSNEGFENYAKERLVLLEADFPQRKKQPAELLKQNETLADKYNPEGAFPKLILLRPDQSVLAVLNYENQSAEAFKTLIEHYLPAQNMQKEFRQNTKLMGCDFELVVVAPNEETAQSHIEMGIREMKRIEQLLTEFSDTSQTAQLNRAAGIESIKVDTEVYQILQRCKEISTLTQGAFDITAGALKKLYNFKGGTISLPDSTTIAAVLQLVGYKNIELRDSNRVFLRKKGMHIGFGAIGKGYGADRAKALLVKNGVQSGVINASGDLTAWGARPDGSPWKIGIADPRDTSKIMLWLPIENASVATSGNYEQFFEWQGVRYSHNIDPKTGYPVKGLKSVTIISPSAELSDALATAVYVMGVKVGLHFIEQLPSTHCIIIDEQNQLHYSSKLKLN